MVTADDLELAAWRALAPGAGVSAMLRASAERCGSDPAIDRLAVMRLDGRDRVGTIAAWPTDARAAVLPLPNAAGIRAWLDLAREGSRGWRSGERDALRDAIDPGDGVGSLIAATITADGRSLLVIQCRGEELPTAPWISALRRPLAIAIAWDSVAAPSSEAPGIVGRDDFGESIIGADSGLAATMESIEQVAPTEAPVLILGETGSGKEVVARAIHARSRRANGPFLRVNCGAIPTELVDSELFGHERGSFTGATDTRKGWFERARGGTLFLDEIAELPAAAQVRLLRVLHDGGFERVGGQQALLADVRIVAATHRDVREMVAAGTFREDLWYRISVFPLRLPPLRARRQDIAPLARYFAERSSRRLHGVALAPSVADLERLRAYPWPGNVRELSTVIERAVILGRGRGLDLAAALGVLPSEETDPDPGSLAGLVRRAIETALLQARGRIEGPEGAARALGLHPATLRSRIRRLGIDPAGFRSSPYPRTTAETTRVSRSAR